MRVPPILLEDDFDIPPPVAGPGRRFASTPAPTAPVPEADFIADYGTGRVWLTARDPHTLHVAWDLTVHQQGLAGDALALRIYAESGHGDGFQQVSLSVKARSAFVRVERPGGNYVAEIGWLDRAGVWQAFARSATVTTPVQRAGEEPRVVQFVTVVPPMPAPPSAPFVVPSALAPPALVPATEPAVEPSAPPFEKPEIPLPALESPTAELELPPLEAMTLAPAPDEPVTISAPAPSVAPAAVPAETSGSLPVPVPPPPAHLPLKPEQPESQPAPSPAPWILAPTPAWPPAQQVALDEFVGSMMTVPQGPSSAEMVGRAGGEAGPEGQLARPSSPVEGFGLAAVGPEALSSGAAVPESAPGGRGFWFNINAELIVYGATEPDATVTIEGRPIRLRPDGSFSLRFALPDGEYTLRALAASADGAEARAARLAFVRRTGYQGAVGRHPTDPALPAPPGPAGPSASRKASRLS